MKMHTFQQNKLWRDKARRSKLWTRMVIETERLYLREWTEKDVRPNLWKSIKIHK